MIGNKTILRFLALGTLLALQLAASSYASAQEVASRSDWSAVLSQRGFGASKQETKAGRINYKMEGNGIRLSVQSGAELTQAQGRRIVALYDTISAWKSLSAVEYSFSADNQELRLLVLPKSLKDGETDLTPLVPGGLAFVDWNGETEYDFRLKVNAYFIRVRGILTGERDLLDRIGAAAADPGHFIRENDPAYLAFQIEELQKQTTVLAEQLAESKAALQTLAADATLQIGELQKESSQLAEQLTESRAVEEILAADLEKTSLAAVAALTKGLFGAPQPPDQKAIGAIREIKGANGAATVEQIAVELKNRELAATNKQIKAVLSVYFGEY